MISTVAVVGAGTMGHAIAAEFALYGHPVRIYESHLPMRESATERIRHLLGVMRESDAITAEQMDATMDRLTLTASLQEAVAQADLVVEAIAEQMEPKRELFSGLHAFCKETAIFATNTSSLTLSEMIAHLPYERRCRCLVCHYFNPANLIPIVEVSNFGETLPQVFEEMVALYRSVGKHPIPILRDVPGMVVNRMHLALFREALNIVDEGVTTVKDADTALMYGSAFRYMAVGLFGGYDMGGLEVGMTVANNIWPALCNGDHAEADGLIATLVSQGKCGITSGEGFYKYAPAHLEELKGDFFRKLLQQRAHIDKMHGN